jgi:hypothetical protein
VASLSCCACAHARRAPPLTRRRARSVFTGVHAQRAAERLVEGARARLWTAPRRSRSLAHASPNPCFRARSQYQARTNPVAFRADMMGSVYAILASVPVQHCRNWIMHFGY